MMDELERQREIDALRTRVAAATRLQNLRRERMDIQIRDMQLNFDRHQLVVDNLIARLKYLEQEQ